VGDGYHEYNPLTKNFIYAQMLFHNKMFTHCHLELEKRQFEAIKDDVWTGREGNP
jgi:hypothetical protein